MNLQQLQQFSPNLPLLNHNTELDYGTVRGSEKLRSTIAANYAQYPGSQISAEDILVTQGAISANFLVLDTLCGPGDHVICQVPNYQQNYEVPARAGADVSFWKLKMDGKYELDVQELSDMIRPTTKLIVLK